MTGLGLGDVVRREGAVFVDGDDVLAGLGGSLTVGLGLGGGGVAGGGAFVAEALGLGNLGGQTLAFEEARLAAGVGLGQGLLPSQLTAVAVGQGVAGLLEFGAGGVEGGLARVEGVLGVIEQVLKGLALVLKVVGVGTFVLLAFALFQTLAGGLEFDGLAFGPGAVFGDAREVGLDDFLGAGVARGGGGGLLGELGDGVLAGLDTGVGGGDGAFAGLCLGLDGKDFVCGLGQGHALGGDGRLEGSGLTFGQGQVDAAQFRAEGAGLFGLLGLTLQLIGLTAQFAQDVGEAGEVLLGLANLAEGLAAVGTELGHAGGLFEDGAAVLGTRGEDGVDLALGQHGVTRGAHARAHEESLDVLQAARGLVEEVGVRAVAIGSPRDGDLVKLRPQGLLAFGKDERHLGHAQGLARVRAVEDDVLHLGATQGAGALLAEHPPNRVRHVALAATIRPHNGNHPRLEREPRLVREAFEALNLQRL